MHRLSQTQNLLCPLLALVLTLLVRRHLLLLARQILASPTWGALRPLHKAAAMGKPPLLSLLLLARLSDMWLHRVRNLSTNPSTVRLVLRSCLLTKVHRAVNRRSPLVSTPLGVPFGLVPLPRTPLTLATPPALRP